MHSENNDDSLTVSLSDEEAVKKIIIDSVFGLWSIVDNLTRLRPTKQDHYRVTIFGSARAAPDSLAYQQVRKLAAFLAAMGCDIVTGGGPGLMQAANEGADEGGDSKRCRSVGIRVHLPFEQGVNPFVKEGYAHGTFFSRLHHFMLASDAFVIVPGGIGTTLEAMMVWQLLQVKHLEDAPLIFVGKMWEGLYQWMRDNLTCGSPPLANPEDLEIPHFVETPDAVMEIISEKHRQWSVKQKKTAKKH